MEKKLFFFTSGSMYPNFSIFLGKILNRSIAVFFGTEGVPFIVLLLFLLTLRSLPKKKSSLVCMENVLVCVYTVVHL